MTMISVDENLCLRDGICAATCPLGLVQLAGGKGTPTTVAGAEQLCIQCGHCVSVCPSGALSLDAMPVADCPPVRPELALNTEQAEQFLRSRRSIRAYQSRAVERETLTRLLTLARFGPTGGNSQQLGWYVVDSPEGVREIGGMVIDLMRHLVETRAPFADRYPLGDMIDAWDKGADPIIRGAPALVFAGAPKDYGMGPVDCTIALTCLDLVAPTLGLGTCWAGFVMMAIAQWPPLRELLTRALPEGHSCHGAMMVGYPKHRYHRLPQRKPASITWQSQVPSTRVVAST